MTKKKMRTYFLILLTLLIVSVIILLYPKGIQPDGSVHLYPGDHPYILTLSQDGLTLYVGTDDGISIIDKASMLEIDGIPFSSQFWDMKLDPSGQYIYCTYPSGGSGPGCISRIRLSDKSVETLSLSPADVYNFAFNDTGDYVYVGGGTWPIRGEGYDIADWEYNLDSGRIFEIRTSDLTVTRSLNVGIDNKGLSYQNGKLAFMTIEETGREDQRGGEWEAPAMMCYIVDVETFETEYNIPVPEGMYNTSYVVPGNYHVMGGFNCTYPDGVGLGLINVNSGEVEHWYLTDPDMIHIDNEEGGGWMMTVDGENNIVYSTLFCTRSQGQSQYRFGVIDLNTNEYSDWYVAPFRVYSSILFDHTSGKLYLTAPLDDAIVVLEPPGYNHPPVADFSFNPGSGPSPLTVTFANSSYDEDGEIVRIECDWNGDQVVDEWKTGNPSTFDHTFIDPGYYNFILTVVDNDNLTDSWAGSVYAEPPND